MANTSASTSLNAETMLLDIAKMTPEKWRALIYNKIVKLKDIFVTDFKTTIIKSIDETMTNVKPDKALESILKGLQMKIKEIKFDVEYHRFIDCIVGVTFEYFCQLIITNSFDNIKRTQNALSCFAVPNKINAVESGSNDNTGEVNLSQLFNNTSPNNTSPILLNDHSSKINNIPLPMGLSGLNLANNFIHTAQPSMNSEEEEESKSDSCILSIAMNINEQDLDIKFADDFENDDMNQSSKLEEEHQIKTSLKLLENLVNIEHNKLEVQKTLAEKNLPQSNIGPDEKKQGKILNNLNFKKNLRFLETPNQNTNEEVVPQDTEFEKKDLKKKTKSKKKHSHQDRTLRKKFKKSEVVNNLNITLASDLSTKMQIDKIYSNYNTNSELTKSTSSNIQASINSKETLSKIELKKCSSKIENISVNKKESTTSTTINDSNRPSIKTNPIASTSNYKEEDGDLTNIKSSNSSSLAKTAEDYKRIYEEDRKSLFSPDIIFNSKKEQKLIKSDDNKHASDKKSKTKSKKINDNLIIVRITGAKDKMKVHNEDTKLHKSSSKQKYSLGETVKHYKIKKPKKHRSHNKVKANADTINENKKLNTTQIIENEELNSSKIILENQESSNEQVLGNQDLSIKQSLEKQVSNNEQSLLENQVLNTDSSENNTMPEWIKVLMKSYKIKPCYVFIEKDKRY